MKAHSAFDCSMLVLNFGYASLFTLMLGCVGMWVWGEDKLHECLTTLYMYILV